MKWNKSGGNIFLCCFGVFPTIEDRLRKFIENTDNAQTTLYDPYTLQVIILDELHTKMDSIVWDLLTVFNHTEEVRNPSPTMHYADEGRKYSTLQVQLRCGQSVDMTLTLFSCTIWKSMSST